MTKKDKARAIRHAKSMLENHFPETSESYNKKMKDMMMLKSCNCVECIVAIAVLEAWDVTGKSNE